MDIFFHSQSLKARALQMTPLGVPPAWQPGDPKSRETKTFGNLNTGSSLGSGRFSYTGPRQNNPNEKSVPPQKLRNSQVSLPDENDFVRFRGSRIPNGLPGAGPVRVCHVHARLETPSPDVRFAGDYRHALSSRSQVSRLCP